MKSDDQNIKKEMESTTTTTMTTTRRRPTPIKLQVSSKTELSLKDPSEFTEAEKMVSSLPFDFRDETLLNGQAYAKILLRKLNTSDPLDTDTHSEIFSQLLGITISSHILK